MIRVIATSERKMFASSATAPTAVAAASVQVLPNQVYEPQTEIAFRYIQNVGTKRVYVCFGQTSSATQYHVAVDPGSQLDCSNNRQQVNAICAGSDTSSVVGFWFNRVDMMPEN